MSTERISAGGGRLLKLEMLSVDVIVGDDDKFGGELKFF